MTPQELLDLFRIEIQDLAKPPMWSDDEVYKYMTEAQEMFCRLGGGIADSTNSLTRITAVANEPFSEISPRILKIRQATRVSDNQVLDILNFEDFERPSLYNDYGKTVIFKLDNTTGQVVALIEGMEQDKVRWYYVPSVDQDITLIVYRLPLCANLDQNSKLEIHSQHHVNLLHWIKYRAYCKQDAEAYDRGKAEEFKQKFMEYCALAKNEREKREHKYRSLVYGGI